MAIAEEMAESRMGNSEVCSTDAGGGLQGISDADAPIRHDTALRAKTNGTVDPRWFARQSAAFAPSPLWSPQAQLAAAAAEKFNQATMPSMTDSSSLGHAMPFLDPPALDQAALAAPASASSSPLLSLLAASSDGHGDSATAAALASAALADLWARETMQVQQALSDARAWNNTLSGQQARQAVLMQPGMNGSSLASMAAFDKPVTHLSDFKLGHGSSVSAVQAASDMAAQPYLALLMPPALQSASASSPASAQGDQLPSLAAFMPGSGQPQLTFQRLQQQASGMMPP